MGMLGLHKLSSRTCGFCNLTKILRWRKKQRFCSIFCMRAWNRGSNHYSYKDRILFICIQCKKEFYDLPFRKRSKEQACSTKCARIRMGINRRLSSHPNWNGGRYKTSEGYILAHAPDNHPYKNPSGLVFEHRLIMEDNLGRFLTKIEEVHHINRKREDNRIENLQLFPDKSSHIKLHVREFEKFGFITTKKVSHS